MVQWDSGQYLKFERERTQPAIDLAGRIDCPAPRDVLDVGCGPGNSSRVLARRFPGARVLGVDSSPDMLTSAKAGHPDLEFALCDAGKDLGGLGTGCFDVVFSNACIQWIPDHPRLLRGLLALLRPGGVLAVQTPMNYDAPIHRIIAELVTGPKWKEAFPNPRIFHNMVPEQYFDLLAEVAADFTLWQTTYFHVLGSHADIMEWYRGTGLRPYLSALSDPDKAAFEADVLAQVTARYPKQQDGRIIFRFPRFFFTATAKAC